MSILYITFFSSTQHTVAWNTLIFHSKEAKDKRNKYFIDHLLSQLGKLWVLTMNCEDCTLMNVIQF